MKILYFAWVRQKIGIGEETLALPAGTDSVAALAGLLARRGAGYAEVFADTSRLRVAVNQTHCPFEASVTDDDEVAFFPPVTGG